MKPRITKAGIEGVESLVESLRTANDEFYARYPGEPVNVPEEAYDELRFALIKHIALYTSLRAGE